LMDVVVGVHNIMLPEGLKCKGVQGEGNYKSNPPGLLFDESTIRGWRNLSPCDITGFYVFPNGTERWMTDLPTGTPFPHFEITYLTHNFVFKLNDDRVAVRFVVKPENIPSCPRIYNQGSLQQFTSSHQLNATLSEVDVRHNAMIIAAANEVMSLLSEQESDKHETDGNMSQYICPLQTMSTGPVSI
jgi:hypothetical protein